MDGWSSAARVNIWSHEIDLASLFLGYQHVFFHVLPYLSPFKVELEEVSYSSIQSGHRGIGHLDPKHRKSLAAMERYLYHSFSKVSLSDGYFYDTRPLINDCLY